MVTPADLAAWRDKLVQARLSGVREVQDSNGERVRYATDSEMAAAIAAADRLLSARTPSTIRFSTSKGI